MVRSTHYLRIIEQERLVENAGKVGAYFLDQLRDLQTEEPLISAARGPRSICRVRSSRCENARRILARLF